MKNTPDSSSNGKGHCAGERAAVLVALRERIAAVTALAPSSFDESAVRVLLGNPEPLRTLREVAIAFGRQRNTIQTSWRGGSMPGASGAYDPVAILCWLLQRESKRADQSSNGNAYLDD